MNRRAIVSILAATLVVGCAGFSLARRSGRDASEPIRLVAAASVKPAAKPAPKVKRQVVASYFHGNFRCVSCKRIEAWTAETIKKDFAKDIKAGRLVWRVVNTDTKGNEHYKKDYQLYTKSVVLSDVKNGKETRWKNLERVWDLLHDEAAFKGYVHEEVAAYLKGA